MTLREAIVVGLALFHASLLAICAETGNQQTCRPSSCGEIRDIRYPFRLESDPSGCGDPQYELACENNRTVVYLPNGRNSNNIPLRYYVADINYTQSTIRVVDPGVEKGNCFSTPLHSSIRAWVGEYFTNSYYLDWERVANTIVMMKCEQPMSSSDGNYIRITPCNTTNLTSSSQPYFYALVGAGDMVVGDIDCSCTMGMTIIIQNIWDIPAANLSMSDLQEAMLLGLDLSFFYFHCESECEKKGLSCDMKYGQLTIQCSRRWNLLRIILHIPEYIYATIMTLFSFVTLIEGFPYLFEGDIIFRVVDGAMMIANLIAVIIIGRAVLGIMCMFAYLIYKFRRRHLSLDDGIEEFLCKHQNLLTIKYSYSDIKKMTHNFKDKLGQGGFGTVYKGKLQSGRIVAIKMLIMSKANGQDFINEVATIGRIHHVNVVRLVGFCIERSKWALIYDFMPNGSLDKFVLHQGNNIPLSWGTLYRIALGVGHGINYLHHGCDMQILHFDIKPHNILLDNDFTPKVSDFGLAKLYSTDESIVSITAGRGTLGYMAPELFYKNIGGVSFKADVYSFGMLLLEIVGKRKNLNAFAEHSSQIYFPAWIYDKFDQGEDMEIGDATQDERKYVEKMVIVALWCIQMKPLDRPSMSKALEMLEGGVELLKMPPKPTLCPTEMPLEKHEQPMIVVPVSSFNSAGSITLDGR